MIAGRGRARIRPPRRGLAGGNADMEDLWPCIQTAFKEIHTRNASQLSYEQLYRDCYRIVLKKSGQQLYDHVRNFEREWLTTGVRPDIVASISSQLWNEQTVGAASNNELRTAGERFLMTLRDAYRHHEVCMAMIADTLMYMDRVYCQDHKVPSIYTAAMGLFRDVILLSQLPENYEVRTMIALVVRTLLDQIRLEREGDIINKSVVKSAVTMLESLYENDKESEGDRLYVLFFEPEYLTVSRQFYEKEAEFLIGEATAGAYCKHAHRRINEEADRCKFSLSETTLEKIVDVVKDEMIRKRIKEVVAMDSGVQFMSDNDRLDELSLVYSLEALVDEKKTCLTKAIQKRLVAMGNDLNKAALAASQAPHSAADKDGEKKASATERNLNQQTAAALKWVEDVLVLKDKFDRIWKIAFKEDQYIQADMTRSFSEFINSVTFPRASEYISLFIDENMKKGLKGKTESEIDDVLDKAITLLRYLTDKDLFERYYKKHLSRRLLMNKSVSNEVEKQMISKMKIELGNSFTMKLEAMFKDMALSEELSAGFKAHVDGLGDKDTRRVELSIQVLTCATWPLDSMSATAGDAEQKTCVYPAQIANLKRSFEKYYGTKHQGRKLTWLGNMGTADIKAVFPRVPQKDGTFKERRHELNVSTYAMLILLLFNDLPAGESLTYEEIRAQTNIPPNDLVRNLQSLAVAPKTRILLKEPMSKDVKPTDKFLFNEGFVGKFVKVKVGVVSSGNRVEGDRERRDTEEKIEKDRGGVVEACIVRIMKQRKESTHQNLIAETLAQIAAQFRPDVGMVKRKIEALIDREYLERVEGDSDRYRYLA